MYSECVCLGFDRALERKKRIVSGAIMLGVDVWIAGSAPAFALQVVWGVIALVALVGILKSSHKRVNK